LLQGRLTKLLGNQLEGAYLLNLQCKQPKELGFLM